MVHAAISQAKLTVESNRLVQLIQELQESLKRVIAHLRVLSGSEKGIAALAEIEMQEEIAFSVLFHDIGQLLPHMLRNLPAERKWPVFLQLAENYLAATSNEAILEE